MNDKLLPINRRWWIKKGKIKEDKIKEKFRKSNDHWNDWKLQLYWGGIE